MARTQHRRDWEKENIQSYTLRLNKNTEPELTEHLERNKPYNGFIKKLIREDLERTKEN